MTRCPLRLKNVPGARRLNDASTDLACLRALAHEGPALVDVIVNRQELSMPPTIKLGQAAGYGLYIMRAVMNGRADEVIDLAKTNLFR